MVVSFPNGVIERQLVKLVLSCAVDTLFEEKFDEAEGLLLIFDGTSFKQRCLEEIDNVILDRGDIKAKRVDHFDNIVDISFLELLEKLPGELG